MPIIGRATRLVLSCGLSNAGADMRDQSSDFRHVNGRFSRGHPGGPGRPRKPVSTVAVDLDRLGGEVAQELMQLTIERARKGNQRATEMVLQRVWPVRRSRPIELDPLPGEGLPDLLGQHAALARAMIDGEVSPQDAQAATRVLKA